MWWRGATEPGSSLQVFLGHEERERLCTSDVRPVSQAHAVYWAGFLFP